MIARGVFTSVPDLKTKAHALHPPIQRATQAREVEVLRSNAANYSRINCYSPLVRLNTIFSQGVCDWTKPGVSQAPIDDSWLALSYRLRGTGRVCAKQVSAADSSTKSVGRAHLGAAQCAVEGPGRRDPQDGLPYADRIWRR